MHFIMEDNFNDYILGEDNSNGVYFYTVALFDSYSGNTNVINRDRPESFTISVSQYGSSQIETYRASACTKGGITFSGIRLENQSYSKASFAIHDETGFFLDYRDENYHDGVDYSQADKSIIRIVLQHSKCKIQKIKAHDTYYLSEKYLGLKNIKSTISINASGYKAEYQINEDFDIPKEEFDGIKNIEGIINTEKKYFKDHYSENTAIGSVVMVNNCPHCVVRPGVKINSKQDRCYLCNNNLTESDFIYDGNAYIAIKNSNGNFYVPELQNDLPGFTEKNSIVLHRTDDVCMVYQDLRDFLGGVSGINETIMELGGENNNKVVVSNKNFYTEIGNILYSGSGVSDFSELTTEMNNDARLNSFSSVIHNNVGIKYLDNESEWQEESGHGYLMDSNFIPLNK